MLEYLLVLMSQDCSAVKTEKLQTMGHMALNTLFLLLTAAGLLSSPSRLLV